MAYTSMIDDGTLIGSRVALQQDWDLVEAQGPSHGLNLSKDKSLVSNLGENQGENPLDHGV